MIHLERITENNFEDCVKLCVKQEQTDFIESNLYSLAQAYAMREIAWPFAIYNDDVVVGFIMLSCRPRTLDYGIWRLMIDAKYQRKGYGTRAVELALEYLRERGAAELVVEYNPENGEADRLFRRFGFEPVGQPADGRVMSKLVL